MIIVSDVDVSRVQDGCARELAKLRHIYELNGWDLRRFDAQLNDKCEQYYNYFKDKSEFDMLREL